MFTALKVSLSLLYVPPFEYIQFGYSEFLHTIHSRKFQYILRLHPFEHLNKNAIQADSHVMLSRRPWTSIDPNCNQSAHCRQEW